jgi:hypothetical protein
MKRYITMIAVVAVVLSSAGCPTIAVGAERVDGTRVAIVLAPYLTWEDLDSDNAPFLKGAIERGAIGALNTRNRNMLAGPASPEQGALTLSAGVWAAEDGLAPTAYSVTEYYEGGTAAEAFERMSGVSALDRAVVFLGMPRTQRLNDMSETLAVKPGTLGGAVLEAGGWTAAIGNSDSGYEVRGMWRSRPAALVAMGHEGTVPFGDVSTDLLKSDPLAPYGISTDRDALEAALAALAADVADRSGPGLVVLDAGDLQRAQIFSPDAAPDVAADHHAAAVHGLDEVVRMAADFVGADGAVFVVPQAATSEPKTPVGLSPVIGLGAGLKGLLTSSSTQRAGLVTDMDVTATALELLGITRPTWILGNPMDSDGSSSPARERIDELSRMNETARAVDTAKPGVLNSYIAITTLVLLLSTIVVLRARRWSGESVGVVTRLLKTCLIAVLAVPVASILMFVFDGSPVTAGQAVMYFALALVATFVVGVVLMYRAPARVPAAVLSLGVIGLLLVDQWIGTPWSFSSFLGYSPLLGARYYGMGNEGAALLVGATLVGLSLLFDQYPESRATELARRWVLPPVAFLVVVTAAAPFAGANVGVAVWGIVAFVVAWAQMNGVRVGLKAVGVMFVLAVIAVAVFSFVDLSSDTGMQTHLGRAWGSAASGGVGELWLIVARKAETNLRVLTRTNWSYLLVAVLAFLSFMRWRPQGDFAATLDENPHFSAALSASLVGGFVAYLTEDSGIVIPALILLYGGTAILYLMLLRARFGTTTSREAVGE